MLHSHVKPQSSWIVVLDLGCLLLSILLAVVLRFGHAEIVLHVYTRLDGWLLFVSSILIANYMAGSYRIQFSLSRFNMVVTWLFSMAFAVFIISLTSYASWFKILLGRGVLGLAVVFYSVFSLYLRIVIVRWIYAMSGVAKRVAILGHAEADRRLRDYLQNPFILPQHRVVAWIDVCSPTQRRPATLGPVVDGIPVVEATPDELLDALLSLEVELLVVGRSAMREFNAIHRHLRKIHFSGIEVMNPLSVSEIYCGRVALEMMDDHETLRMGIIEDFPVVLQVKRVGDMIVAILGGLLTAPLMLTAALLIKLSNPWQPAFYSQTRVGKLGRPFTIRKLRTMRPDAESESGAIWSCEDDPRITFLGRFLRKFRIDELPQFWNVLVGDMSLVGPRPERPEIARWLATQIPLYSEREYVLPGLSGWAQIHCPYGNTVEAARRKLEYDLFYIRNMSPSLDLQIVLRTLRIVLLGKEKES